MGSYCGINFDNLSICDSKSYVPTEWAMLFQEVDRRSEIRLHEDSEPEDEPSLFTWYEIDRNTFLLRLSLLGATDAAMKFAFDNWLIAEQEEWAQRAIDWDKDLENYARRMQINLERFDFEIWKRIAHQTLRTRYNFKSPYEPSDEIEKNFHDGDYLWVGGYGSMLGLRTLLEACPKVQAVKLDVSDLIANGYYEEDDKICSEARRGLPLINQPLEPTIIMGEGSTDLLVLQRSLEALYPNFVEYFSFFNHSEFSVDGGANYLVKFLKAFAAAKFNSRIVAIFDNDAVGIQAFDQANALKLPLNILIMKLPNIDLAKSYPTIGPSGPADLDVNGTAAGIELYLGRDALTLGGAFRPVRWAGYIQSIQKYQGEVEGKSEILYSFLRKLESKLIPEKAQAEFPELEQIWLSIFKMVEKNAENQYLIRHRQITSLDL